MKLGISSYALTWSIGVPGYAPPQNPLQAIDLINITKNAGLNVVQYADNLPLHLLEREELVQLARYAYASSIEIEVGTRGTEQDRLMHYLDICKTVKSPFLRTLITTPDLEEAKSDIHSVLPFFEEAGVAIAIENHGLHTTEQLVSFFDTINSEYVKCCLDTVNSFGALEGSEPVIQALAPYTINLHIKDFTIRRVDHQMGFEIIGTPAGKGRLDLKRVYNILSKNKREPSAVLELWTPYTQSVEESIELENLWLQESIEYLHQFLNNSIR